MDLKTLFGDELYGKITEALKGKGKDGKDVELLVNDGTYIPKAKFDEKLEEVKTLKTEITTRDGQLTELQKKVVGNAELEKQLAELKAQNGEWENKLKDSQITAAIKLAAVNAKAKDADIIAGLVDKSKLKLKDDGSVEGLDGILTDLQKSKAFLFGETVPPGSGNNPPDSGGMTELQKLQTARDEAIKKGDFINQVSLERQIFELEQKSNSGG